MKKRLIATISASVVFIFGLGIFVHASFSDIGGHKYQAAIEFLQSKKIVAGYPDGTFKPDSHINRAELLAIVVGQKYKDLTSFSCFSDVDSRIWYARSVCNAMRGGIVAGYPDGSFKPAKNVNFVEALIILQRAHQISVNTSAGKNWYDDSIRSAKNMKIIPPDVYDYGAQITRGQMAELVTRLLKYEDGTLDAYLKTPQNPQKPPTKKNCTIFPADNPWNRDVSKDAVNSRSDAYINSIGKDGHLHADFGGNGEYGIPYITVNAKQPKVPITFTDYGEESDAGPYPIPANAPIEGGSNSDGDRHVIVLDTDSCILYELFYAFYDGPGWRASSGAIFDLTSNALRHEGYTSADAAGLPIFPGLVRYDEVAAGHIDHAVRFTVNQSQKGYIHPATHYASHSTDANLPPMGLRLRLKSNYDISQFTGQSRVILEALKKYGMIVADNGSNWYISGDSDPRWNDDDLNQLKTVPGFAFEAVDSGEIIK